MNSEKIVCAYSASYALSADTLRCCTTMTVAVSGVLGQGRIVRVRAVVAEANSRSTPLDVRRRDCVRSRTPAAGRPCEPALAVLVYTPGTIGGRSPPTTVPLSSATKSAVVESLVVYPCVPGKKRSHLTVQTIITLLAEPKRTRCHRRRARAY